MQSSAGKEIEIRAALSSDYGPSPNTGQSFFEKLGQNSDRLLTNFEIPNTCSSTFVFGIFTKSTRSCSVRIMFVFCKVYSSISIFKGNRYVYTRRRNESDFRDTCSLKG